MAEDHKNIKIDDPDFYMTDAISDHALEMIRRRPQDKPFFIYVAYTAPHWPLQAPQADIDAYRDTYKAGWDVLRGERYQRMLRSGILPAGAELTPRFESIPAWDSLSTGEQHKWSTKMAIYAAMISIIDRGVGRITELLDAQGVADNTIVIFLSDNGSCPFPVNYKKGDSGSVPGGKGSAVSYDYPWANVSSTPFRFFKRWSYEGGINVPMIVRYPGVTEKGKICNATAHVMDILPTCLDYAGARYPAQLDGQPLNAMDGRSMRGVLAGQQRATHASLCWEHYGNRAIRKGDWKLVFNSDPGTQEWELYNLANDRTEMHNVIEQNRAMADALAAEYDGWMKDYKVIPFDRLKNKKK
jgi:arylsulfatase